MKETGPIRRQGQQLSIGWLAGDDRGGDMTIEILDTHQHLIYADRFGYQWTDPIPALAGRSFTYADYLDAAADTGISSTLFMEATSEDWRAETDMVQEMVENPDMIVSGIIAGCRPEDPDFDAWLDAISERPVAGLRVVRPSQQGCVWRYRNSRFRKADF